MNKFVIGKIDNSDNIIIRLLDIETGEIEDVDFDSFYKEAINNGELYRDTNLDHYVNSRTFTMSLIKKLPLINDNDTNKDEYTVLKRANDGETFILSNAYGKIVKAKEEELINYKCINVLRDKDKNIRQLVNVVIDPIKCNDTEKEKEIARKYKKFILKTSILNSDNRFNYRVDGEEVILTNYKGASEEIIIPNFVTVIGEEAFSLYWSNQFKVSVKKLTLSDGLKRICTGAFKDIHIEKLVVPRTVQVIEKGAFGKSRLTKEVDGKYILDKNKVVLHNGRTKVEDWE